MSFVATVLTVYGIETISIVSNNSNTKVATVLTVYGIETSISPPVAVVIYLVVATVLTVYGIETLIQKNIWKNHSSCNSTYRLRY